MTTGSRLRTLLSSGNQFLQAAFTPTQILLSFLITVLMTTYIYYIYKKTFSGILYSKNFNLTLIVIALVVNAIMIGISGNIVLSLGLVGALSIIRFRTAVKDPRDTAFLFWAITVGIINGVAYYELSIIASLFISLALLIFSKKESLEISYILIVVYETDLFPKIKKILEKYSWSYTVRSDTHEGKNIEKAIEVKVEPDTQEKVLKEIRELPNIKKCILISSSGDFVE
ncbi:DUF4956 domain-containing protein [Candidatus Dojkabacteria bacterium]|uniref:DUF4956 domain-containing protein n=1 Tax=Candidatus Dojkabacteria bacterium TaxID=2099670 RepID=A0A847VCZ8_9BACT|nr:DUF4956 domain-containing protein [Candidatus Dojkabacteria bacterium]